MPQGIQANNRCPNVAHLWITKIPDSLITGENADKRIANLKHTHALFAKECGNEWQHLIYTNDLDLLPQTAAILAGIGIKLVKLSDLPAIPFNAPRFNFAPQENFITHVVKCLSAKETATCFRNHKPAEFLYDHSLLNANLVNKLKEYIAHSTQALVTDINYGICHVPTNTCGAPPICAPQVWLVGDSCSIGDGPHDFGSCSSRLYPGESIEEFCQKYSKAFGADVKERSWEPSQLAL